MRVSFHYAIDRPLVFLPLLLTGDRSRDGVADALLGGRRCSPLDFAGHPEVLSREPTDLWVGHLHPSVTFHRLISVLIAEPLLQ